jgi:L-alanine-DL-glutamate epimerase-like enolase superfamily enzyme
MQWSIEWIILDLRYTWKISRNASEYKMNAIITAQNGRWKGIGEVAPNIRYNETQESIQQAFNDFVGRSAGRIHDLKDLEAVLNEIKLPNALRFGIESAFIHMLCHAEQCSIYDLLHIEKPEALPTSYSFPIMEIGDLRSFYEYENLARFSLLKIKVNASNAVDTIKAINQITNVPLIIDANESFQSADEVIQFYENISGTNVACIEQPLPASLADEYKKLKPQSPYLLMADESVCDDADFDAIAEQFHGINMKLMKAGGYLNGLRILNEARLRNLKTMIGCMIETTLGISSAMHLCAGVDIADLDGFLILKNEPYKLVKEEQGKLSIQ